MPKTIKVLIVLFCTAVTSVALAQTTKQKDLEEGKQAVQLEDEGKSMMMPLM